MSEHKPEAGARLSQPQQGPNFLPVSVLAGAIGTKNVLRLRQPRSGFWGNALSRGFALFLGGFGLLNVCGNLLRPGFDANVWWLDARWLPPLWSSALITVASACLILFSLRPPRSIPGRAVACLSACALLAIALGNSLNFFILLDRKEITSRLPIPFSLLIAGALLLILISLWRQSVQKRQRTDRALPRQPRELAASLAVCLACTVVFPLVQMFCFGKTNYSRASDVTVVLGARVYADGCLSDALADRVRTGCELYKHGMTYKLLFSGGPGDGAIHETEAMKQMAIRLGVRPEDILLDKQGLNTAATVRNTKAMFSGMRASRIMLVSHFYHLPRIKLAYQREGLEVYTVPAKERYILGQLPFNMAREVAALWVYYLRPLA